MIAKNHCKMLFEREALLGYLQYYDYTSSYSVVEDADEELLMDLSETLLNESEMN